MKMSPDINEIAAALVQARPKFTPITKTHTATVASQKGAYKYTYATLEDVYEATTAALSAAGVFALHNIETATNAIGVTTLLMHSSGQYIQTDPVWLPAGTTPQSVGSAISYARRYSLQAALGVAAEEDDDGQQAAKGKPAAVVAPAPAKPAAAAAAAAPPAAAAKGGDRVISEAQIKRFFAIARKHEWRDDDLKALIARRGYESTKAIRMSDYDGLIEALESGVIEDDREPGGDDEDDGFGLAPWEQDGGAR